jgi:hypothetical protein
MPLTAQEIRNAIYAGEWKNYIRGFAESGPFNKATEGRIKRERMDDWELVLRFIAQYDLVVNQKKRPSDQSLVDFLNQTVIDTQNWDETKWASISAAFERAMTGATKVFGGYAFRKYYGSAYYRNPINRGLFESQAVALAEFSTHEISHLEKNSKFVLSKLADRFRTDDSFIRANLYATGSGEASNIRYEAISEILNEVLDAS